MIAGLGEAGFCSPPALGGCECESAVFRGEVRIDFRGAAGWICIRMRTLADDRKKEKDNYSGV